ncbi:WD40-repeat-containing domain protein [Phycomyces blakesleeanus]
MFNHFSSGEAVPLEVVSLEEKSVVATASPEPQQKNSSKIMAWMMPNKKKNGNQDKDNKSAVEDPVDTTETEMLVDSSKLYQYSTKDLHQYATLSGIKMEKASSTPSKSKQTMDRLERTLSVSPTSGCDWSQRMPTVASKVIEKEVKTKVPTSVLPWKTKWKPSPEDKKNWNRFLSTNSEEMSKTMQFSFNDLKLRGFAGHTAAIRTITVNEPSKVFASGSRDRTVKLWSLNAHEGIENWETDPFSESLITYSGHRRGAVNDVHFLSGGSSNGLGDTVASCDGHIHLWDPETGKAIHQFSTSRSSIVSVKPIFHSRNLVGGTMEGNITFFDVHNQTSLHTWKSSSNMTGTIRTIAVNKAETLIAVAYSTGAISLLESRTGTLIASWKGGDTEITMIKFYTDELLVSCAPADHIICCWNVSRLALVKTIPAPQDVASLDIFKDEILTINANNSVSFIPINDDFQSYSSAFKSSIIKSQVSSFAIVPTDQLLLFGCTEGEIFLYA